MDENWVKYTVDYGAYARTYERRFWKIDSIRFIDDDPLFGPRYVVKVMSSNFSYINVIVELNSEASSSGFSMTYNGREYIGSGSIERLRSDLAREEIERKLDRMEREAE